MKIMKMNNKIRNLWIAVVMLAILNLTTIGTIIYHNLQESEETHNIVINPDTKPINGRYFREQLNFDERQMQVFEDANQKFRSVANDLIGNIHGQKELMFVELQSTEPNLDSIKVISTQIGVMHAQLKEATAEFYMTLNAVCDADQKEKMKATFAPLFEETPNMGRGRGGGRGYGRDSYNQ